jgi:hypothetical protein
MKPQILALIALTLLCGACANSQHLAKFQNERKALGVQPSHWGNLPWYSSTIPLNLARLYPVDGESAVRGAASFEFLVNADGSVADVHLVEKSGDDTVAETAKVVYSKLKFAPNKDPGVTQYVIRFSIKIDHDRQIRDFSLGHGDITEKRYAH